jgi:UDP-galactopyranose mutase
LPCDGEALIARTIADCRSVGIIGQNDPIWTARPCDLPYAYVVYDHARPKLVELVRTWLRTQGIILAGRYSEWEYYNSDHAFIAGKKAAETVLKSRQAVDTQSKSTAPPVDVPSHLNTTLQQSAQEV